MTRSNLVAFGLGSVAGLYVWAYLVERLFPPTKQWQPIPTPLPERSYAPATWTSAHDGTTWTATSHI